MSVTKKKYEVIQPQLSDYPLNRAEGRMELLTAHTIYKWDGHYWFAVLKVRATLGDGTPKTSVRGYRWQWKKPYVRRGEAEQPERWMVDSKLTFNNKSQWEDFKKAVDEFIKDLPE